jgi:hypothetical protein
MLISPVLLNASVPILTTPLGMVMSRREEHPEKDAEAMVSSALLSAKKTDRRDVQPRKAELLMVCD